MKLADLAGVRGGFSPPSPTGLSPLLLLLLPLTLLACIRSSGSAAAAPAPAAAASQSSPLRNGRPLPRGPPGGGPLPLPPPPGSPMAVTNTSRLSTSQRQVMLNRSMNERLETIRNTILLSLGYSEPPAVNSTGTQDAVSVADAVKAMTQTDLAGDPPLKPQPPEKRCRQPTASSVSSGAKEVLCVRAEDGGNEVPLNTMLFPLHNASTFRDHKATRAYLYVQLRYKKQPSRGRKNPRKQIDLMLYSMGAEGQGQGERLTTLHVTMRHTKWQKLLLPVSAIQGAVERNTPLRLRLDCNHCDSVIRPVTVLKMAGHSRRSAGSEPGRVMSKGVGKRRPKRRKVNKMALKYNRRRPYLVVRTKPKGRSRQIVKREAPRVTSSRRADARTSTSSARDGDSGRGRGRGGGRGGAGASSSRTISASRSWAGTTGCWSPPGTTPGTAKGGAPPRAPHTPRTPPTLSPPPPPRHPGSRTGRKDSVFPATSVPSQ